MSNIIINDDLRTMQIPSSIALLGVESDDDVNKIPFQMPKEYCGFDLSTFSARINYMNANGVGDVYLVQDLAVDGNDPTLMNFTWLVGRNVCAYKGNVQFIVCLKKFDSNSNVVQEFNTTVYSLPVLEGLETTEAVVQQNPDIIEYILNLLEESGPVDLSNYYTKAEIDAMIPSKLPNPEPLIINGQSYDGSEEVNMNISATTDFVNTATGYFINVPDAIEDEPMQSLKLYDSGMNQLQSGQIAMANKNLFRSDLLDAQVVSKGITFSKNSDGSINANGTSTGTYAMTSYEIDPKMFVIGQSYTLSSGKTVGNCYVQLLLNYSDNTTDYLVARNSPRTFTITKQVVSGTASVQITNSGVTVSNEVTYPQLEWGSVPTVYAQNEYKTASISGSTLPVMYGGVNNIWPADSVINYMVMEYEADAIAGAVDEYVRNNLVIIGGSLAASHDGIGTVTLNLG